MKTTGRLLIFAILAAALITPLRLSAQDLDLSAERAPGTGDDEEVKNEDELEPGDELSKPADTWQKGDYVIVNGSSRNPLHLGPTGLWGFPAGQNVWVKMVTPGSPADGKVLPGDVIYGANGKGFPADRKVGYYFANAITEAETREAGGKLTLHIWRNGKLIRVPIQLKVMGSFSSTTPFNCEKSNNIVARAEDYMRKGLRPETGLPNNGQYMFGPWNDSVLFLLAAGNPETQGLVRRYILKTKKALDIMKAGERGGFETCKGWSFPYIKMLYGEYYHRTGDPTVLPYLEDNGFKKTAAEPEKKWSPPVGPTRYGLHPNPQMVGNMGTILADEAGLKINKDRLLFDLKYLYVKRAEYGYVKYCGYGAIPIEGRQIEKPPEITPENKTNGSYSSMNGKLGTAAAFFSMVKGYDKAVDMCSTRCVYAFNYHGGHGGAWFNGFWTPIGASHAGPEKFQQYMKGQQWWRELYRDHTGAMWETGNARDKKDTLSTGFAIHRTIPRQKLRMFGAPRSMFGPDAPAYLKEALAAHRNRDYARAEQLTLNLQASGKVPAKDKTRVSHFLDSVQTLKRSVEYDLNFTEALLKKGNYALANVELPQLQMVVSPNDSRLKAIAGALDSTKAKAQIASAAAKQEQDAKTSNKPKGISRKDAIANFPKELASLVTLVRDGCKYIVKYGRVTIGTYPMYKKQEITQWSLLTTEDLTKAPTGWEQPGFDDSKWKKSSLSMKHWPDEPALLFRTSFEAKNVSDFKSLRVRVNTGKNATSNFTLYMNGKIVARVTNIPRGGTVFGLKPESLALMKQGKNTLALSTQHGQKNRHRFSLRLEGILKNPQQQETAPPDQKKKKNTKTPKKKGK